MNMMFTSTPMLAIDLLCILSFAQATTNTDSLSIDAGYHVIYSWPGASIPQRLYNLASEGKVGGVIIYGENVNSDLPNQIQNLQDAYAKFPGYSGNPLLITTDQEGGEVVRLPGGPKRSEATIGASAHPPREAKQAAKVAANACKAYNVNGNLAPVLDVYRHAGDFDDQFNRSYSMDPNIASSCGAAFVKAQQGNGVVATGKHFPGLGAAKKNQNTDEEPVTLNVPLHKLRTVDEVPFQGAIAAGIEMIMPSWAVYPALDPNRPSGLSSEWIQDELRGRLGFQGVTISDAIEAGALQAFGNNQTRAILASNAGMDIILAAALDVEQGVKIHDALVAAVKDGKLSRSAFDQSTQRITALRSGL